MPRSVNGALALALLALGGGWVHFAAERDPSRALAGFGAAQRWLGPSPDAVEALSDAALVAAARELANRNRSGVERLAAYRSELVRAQELAAAEVTADPGRSEAWARLAAIRWELAPSVDESAQQVFFEQVHAVAERSRDRPRAQLRLADLMVGLGSGSEAAVCYERALTRRPDLARFAVDKLARRGETPGRIRERLPALPEVLLALRPHFLREAEGGIEYMEILEDRLRQYDADDRLAVLPAYAATALDAGRPERLLETLERLGPFENGAAEAVRVEQRALAWSALGRHEQAWSSIADACPEHPRPAACDESAGAVAAAAGLNDEALASFERASHWVARHADDPITLSRLQFRRGRMAEQEHRFDRARAAYSRALQLNPHNAPARQRMAGLERALRNE